MPLFVAPVRHADLPDIALTNIDCDDIAFLEEHRLGGMLFLHYAPFGDRADAIADCVHLIKLAGMVGGMGLEQDFVPILDLLFARGRLFWPGLNCIRREEVCDRFRIILIERLVVLAI